MPENNFQYVCSADQVPERKSRAFSITGGRGSKIEIALFNLDGAFYAISNFCIHQGGPLSKGVLEGDVVTCPWHGWKYSVKNGMSPHEGGDSSARTLCECLKAESM
jgi:nitrite reductase/ring-hydroxylating ferredoxin subunit